MVPSRKTGEDREGETTSREAGGINKTGAGNEKPSDPCALDADRGKVDQTQEIRRAATGVLDQKRPVRVVRGGRVGIL